MTSQYFLVLRGAPGVGKSTVASLLREHFLQGVCIEIDLLRLMINKIFWDSMEQHLCAIEAASKLGMHYANRGHRPILFIDTFSFGTLNLLTQHLDCSMIRIYSLVASDAVLKERMKQRKEHGFKDWKRSIVINHNIASNPAQCDYVIDTTRLSAKLVAMQIVEREHYVAGN